MATSPGRRLKVFQAQIGFYDTVVAVPSRTAALRVWGTHQNLFANGQARIAMEAAAIEAALQNPGTLLRRAIGSRDPFAEEPARRPDIPPAPARTSRTKKPEPSRPPADRSKLDAAEAALKQLEERRSDEDSELRREAEAIEAKRAATQRTYFAEKRKAQAAVDAAEKAYLRAGGRN